MHCLDWASSIETVAGYVDYPTSNPIPIHHLFLKGIFSRLFEGFQVKFVMMVP